MDWTLDCAIDITPAGRDAIADRAERIARREYEPTASGWRAVKPLAARLCRCDNSDGTANNQPAAPSNAGASN